MLSDKIIHRVAGALRLEQKVVTDHTRILLVSETYLGTKLIYTHEMDLEPLYEAFKERLDNEE
jgi:hypothetical protein